MKRQRSFIISVILCIIFIVNVFSTASHCPLTSNEHAIPCLQKALRNNWQQVIDYLVRQKQAQNKQKFIYVLQQELKRLQILQEQIVLGKSQTQPFIKWGQNRTHIFLTFKLSHRWDSPPCLYTRQQQSRLQKDSLFYNNVCLVSHQKVSFKVNLNLYRSVMLSMKGRAEENVNKKTVIDGQSVEVQQQSSEKNQSKEVSDVHKNYSDYAFDVKKDGVGQYSTILLKQVPEIWLFLTKQQKSYSIWHQISERYQSQFDEYQRSLNTHKLIQRQRVAQSGVSTSANTQQTSQL